MSRKMLAPKIASPATTPRYASILFPSTLGVVVTSMGHAPCVWLFSLEHYSIRIARALRLARASWLKMRQTANHLKNRGSRKDLAKTCPSLFFHWNNCPRKNLARGTVTPMERPLLKGNAQQMKQYNRALVLRLIQQEGPISRVELAKKTGLSPTTVSVITDGLLQDGLIRQGDDSSAPTGGAGRRPVWLEIDPEGAFLIGVDLGVTNTTVVLYDLTSNVRARRTAPTPKGQGAGASIEQILRFITDCLEEAGVLQDQVAGVGFGVPGLVDSDRGISRLSHNLGFRDVPLKEILESRLGIPVFVENVIRMTTLA